MSSCFTSLRRHAENSRSRLESISPSSSFNSSVGPTTPQYSMSCGSFRHQRSQRKLKFELHHERQTDRFCGVHCDEAIFRQAAIDTVLVLVLVQMLAVVRGAVCFSKLDVICHLQTHPQKLMALHAANTHHQPVAALHRK